MPPPIRIVVAEDHSLVRQGIGLLLGATGEFEVVADTALASEVASLVLHHQPDVLLLDLSLHDGSGIEVARATRKAAPNTRILVLTGNLYPGSVVNAFAAGADGFALKQADAVALLAGIRTVAAGQRYISPQIAHTWDTNRAPSVEARALPSLTPREQQVVRLIAKGCSNPEIAEALSISVLTARKHRQNLMLKLGLHNGAEIAIYAIQSGLLQAPDVDRPQ